MRGFFTFILFSLFLIAFPLTVLIYRVSSLMQPTYINNKLVESQIYTSTANTLPSIFSDKDDNVLSPELENTLEEFVKKEITPEYLQGKTESFVKDFHDYFSGKTETPPSITFSELKDKLGVVTQEEPLPEELDKFLSTTYKVNHAEVTSKLRTGYQILQKAALPLGAISIVLLAGIFLLAKGIKSKLRKVSLALLVSSIFGLLSSLSLVFLSRIVSSVSNSALEASPLEKLSESIDKLISLIATDLALFPLIVFGSAIALALLLFIISLFVGNKAKVVEDQYAGVK